MLSRGCGVRSESLFLIAGKLSSHGSAIQGDTLEGVPTGVRTNVQTMRIVYRISAGAVGLLCLRNCDRSNQRQSDARSRDVNRPL
jgi:hypothetical protein